METILLLVFVLFPLILGYLLFKVYKEKKKISADMEGLEKELAKYKEIEKTLKDAENEKETILYKANIEKDNILVDAKKEKDNILVEAKRELTLTEDRIGRLKNSDNEIRARLKQSRNIIEDITDKCSILAADVELITDDELLSSQSYQKDRKEIKSMLKKLAINAIEGVKGSNADVNIGKFIGISAKADIAGALLLTTVEMLCSKVNANNGHNALEKLFETIIATESLIKCIDSRATINTEFRKLLEERLVIEINFKKAKQIAKEEQREIREQEREERKAREEAEKIQKEAEKEERIKNEAIAELESQMLEKSEEERVLFEEELNMLKSELEEVHQRYERARSRAQDTKQGNVYIISNIGSFGKNVFKIGMTRRMEPLDRVHELGNASVPFRFDVHALLESDDAPQLESALHSIFDHKRINKVNRRKEYFNITMDEIEEELNKLNINALINKVPSADEYYQSLKIESKELNNII